VFELFTEQARQVIILAREEAGRFRHDFVGTEHLLLGLIRQSEDRALAVLQRLGLPLETVKAEVERALAGFPRTLTFGEVPFTPQAKRVFELSIEEVRQLGHDYIGTEHLLLGVMKEGQSISAKILESLGARLGEMRLETLALLRDPPQPQTHATGATPVFEQFTERARRVITLARDEAGRFRHDFVGTEHVVLGLIRDGESIATAVLQRLGLRLETVKAEVGRALAGFPKTLTFGEAPFTPQAKRVLELSIEEARQFGHNYIGTEHLLLGLMKEGRSIAAKILSSLSVRALTMCARRRSRCAVIRGGSKHARRGHETRCNKTSSSLNRRTGTWG